MIVTIDATQVPADIDGELSGVARSQFSGKVKFTVTVPRPLPKG